MAGITTNPFSFSNSKDSVAQLDKLGAITLDNPITHMGISYGKSWASGMGNSLWSQLHYYFDVTNSYVLKKLYLLSFPFVQQGEWRQITNDTGAPDTPRYNIYAPDLYIPLMAFITFILLSGVGAGWRGNFSPELLGMAATAGVFVVLFEVILMGVGFYLLQANVPNTLDLVAYSGYKFYPCVMNHLMTLCFGVDFYVLAFPFTVTALGVFIVRDMQVKSLKRYTHHASFTDHVEAMDITRSSFLYALGILQFLLVFILGYYQE